MCESDRKGMIFLSRSLSYLLLILLLFYFLLQKPLGILGILDEECRFPQATDLTFLDKLVKNLSKHPNFEVPKMSKNLFVVNHYAGKVPYTVDGMLEKNKDLLSDDLIGIYTA